MNTYTHLKWMHQSTHVTGILHEFLNSNTFTDVTLVSDENIEYLAHKAVLAVQPSKQFSRNIINMIQWFI